MRKGLYFACQNYTVVSVRMYIGYNLQVRILDGQNDYFDTIFLIFVVSMYNVKVDTTFQSDRSDTIGGSKKSIFI